MQKLFFVLFLCGFLNGVFLSAQTNLDSLWQTTLSMKEDTVKITALRSLSQQYRQHSADTSILLAEKALALAIKTDAQYQAYISWRNGRDIFHALAKLEQAKQWGKKALYLVRKMGKKIDEGELLTGIGLSCWRLGQIDSALYYFQKSEQVFLKTNRKPWKVYANIGRLYKQKNDFDKAFFYLFKALEIVEKTDSRMDAGYVFYLIGELYLIQSDFEKFSHIIDRWEAFKALHPATSSPENNTAHIQAHSFFFENIENKEAKIREGIAYERKVGNNYRAAHYQLTLGEILINENRWIEARQVLMEAFEAQSKNSYAQEEKTILYKLFEISKQLNEPQQALSWMEKYQTLSDSLEKEQVMENLAELEVKYQTEKKEQALILKSLEARRATLERNLLLAGLALFSLLTFGFFYSYHKRIAIKRRLSAHQAQLQAEKIDRLEQEQKVLSLNAMIEGQEKERQRIANDLHDSLGGLLTSVKLHFNAIDPSSQNNTIYQKTNTLIDDACGEVRRISHNMMPKALAFSGLNAAIEDLLQHLDKQNIQSELEVLGLSEDLPATTTIMIYRIIQELINNTIKHAGASQLFIQLFQNKNQLKILVEDNGKGFDFDLALRKKGLGLSSVESRVRFLQGKIYWDSVLGEGTAVNINIPVKKDTPLPSSPNKKVEM